MTYDPKQPSVTERGFQYTAMWIGLGGTVFTLANLFIGMDNILSAMAFGAMAGGPLSFAFSNHPDEYLRSLMQVGLRFMCGVLGLYLMALFFLASGDVSNSFGFWLGSGETQEPQGSIAIIATNALTAVSALSLAFYSGFAFAWLRDRIGGGE